MADLRECLVLHLLRGVQHWPCLIPQCDCVVSCICNNFAVRVMGCADGRGDEKEHAQRSQVSITTTHAFSLMYNIPSINILEPTCDRTIGLDPDNGPEEIHNTGEENVF